MIGSSLRYTDCPKWQKPYFVLFGVPYLSIHIKANAISAWLPTRESNIVLDAGCGRGLFSFWLAQKMPTSKILGTDSAETEITFARQINESSGQKNLSFDLADLRYLPDSENFDLILCLDVGS